MPTGDANPDQSIGSVGTTAIGGRASDGRPDSRVPFGGGTPPAGTRPATILAVQAARPATAGPGQRDGDPMDTTDRDTFPSLAEVEEQERRLVLPAADPASLYALGRRMADAALERRLPVLIQVRLGERLVFVAALPGSTASNDDWAARKARLAAWFDQSSMRVRLSHPPDGEGVYERHSLPRERFAAHGGAFPLRVAGVGMVGTVVVSGLPQVQDHAFVVEMLEAHLAAGA